MCADLEARRGLRHVAWQLADAAGSVAANHRAMRRARSDREFAAKLQIVDEEVDESVLWFEIAIGVVDRLVAGCESPGRPSVDRGALLAGLREATELRAIFASAKRRLRRRIERSAAMGETRE